MCGRQIAIATGKLNFSRSKTGIMQILFRIFSISVLVMAFLKPVTACAQVLPGPEAGAGSRVMLPNGWSLSPAGHSLPLGDLPLNIVVSPSRRYVAVTNNGQSTQTLQLIDVVNERIID